MLEPLVYRLGIQAKIKEITPLISIVFPTAFSTGSIFPLHQPVHVRKLEILLDHQ